MMTFPSVLGLKRSWNLLAKIGEGDAGEVFLVESLLDKKRAILKRPKQGGFPSDVIRQATQIEAEGRVLLSLKSLKYAGLRRFGNISNPIHFPGLIDTSSPGNQFSERYFIVIELAAGFALSSLAKVILAGIPGLIQQTSPQEQKLLQTIAESNRFPRVILVRSIAGILQLFEAVHRNIEPHNPTGPHGLIWNDIKPEHIFWDPYSLRLTFIDWGNAQVLEADGLSKDRRYSKSMDYAQLFDSIGAFLLQFDPELYILLNWPNGRLSETLRSDQSYDEILRPIKEKITHILRQEIEHLNQNRQNESAIINSQEVQLEELSTLFELQNQIANQGEFPDYQGAERLYLQLASRLVNQGQFKEFKLLDQFSHKMHTESQEKWELINEVAELAANDFPDNPTAIRQVISSGLGDDWGNMLWGLLAASAHGSEPAWWNKITGHIRQIGLQIDPTALPPLILLKRAIMEMQATVAKSSLNGSSSPQPEVTAHSNRLPFPISSSEKDTPHDQVTRDFERLLKTLREEIAPNWSKLEPDPPYSTIEYSEIETVLPEINRLAPGIYLSLFKSLEQPSAQAAIILDAWNRQDFTSARQLLRRLLLWDPNRWRVLTSDQAIGKANTWLVKIRKGPQPDQALLEFITEAELMGRELRSHVGPAGWLDLILNAFTQIRKGRRTAELIIEYPELKRELPWLDILEPHRYIAEDHPEPINLERASANLLGETLILGVKAGVLGQDLVLADPLDTWSPEARGSSARVFTGFILNSNEQLKQAAIKIMRPGMADYALPLFREEVRILEILRDTLGVTPLIECGYIKLDDGSPLPSDQNSTSARSVRGEIERFGLDRISNYLSELETRAHQGWLAYLATPKLDNHENLMWSCDAGFTRGRFLPVTESLRLCIQICDLIQIAHDRNIVYRDHKLLHYYWLAHFNGVFMIDWNVSRYHPQGLSKAEIQFDLVQLGARALHHILSGRVAPGALADGPNRVEEIESAANSYGVQWTYDDQRLPPELKTILEQVLAGSYPSAKSIKEDLLRVYNQLFEPTNST